MSSFTFSSSTPSGPHPDTREAGEPKAATEHEIAQRKPTSDYKATCWRATFSETSSSTSRTESFPRDEQRRLNRNDSDPDRFDLRKWFDQTPRWHARLAGVRVRGSRAQIMEDKLDCWDAEWDLDNDNGQITATSIPEQSQVYGEFVAEGVFEELATRELVYWMKIERKDGAWVGRTWMSPKLDLCESPHDW